MKSALAEAAAKIAKERRVTSIQIVWRLHSAGSRCDPPIIGARQAHLLNESLDRSGDQAERRRDRGAGESPTCIIQ